AGKLFVPRPRSPAHLCARPFPDRRLRPSIDCQRAGPRRSTDLGAPCRLDRQHARQFTDLLATAVCLRRQPSVDDLAWWRACTAGPLARRQRRRVSYFPWKMGIVGGVEYKRPAAVRMTGSKNAQFVTDFRSHDGLAEPTRWFWTGASNFPGYCAAVSAAIGTGKGGQGWTYAILPLPPCISLLRW